MATEAEREVLLDAAMLAVQGWLRAELEAGTPYLVLQTKLMRGLLASDGESAPQEPVAASRSAGSADG